MEQEHEAQRQTYGICRLGFAILSFALVLASVSTVLELAAIFARFFIGPGYVEWVFQSPAWQWKDVPIVWGSLVGSYLLWGRWSDPGWQRRAGLLVLMGMVDVILWFIERSDALGLRLTEVGHVWLRINLGEALGWAEFALLASLSCDLMAHLGVEQAPEAGKATRSIAATGAVVWMLSFLERTAWKEGWPLQDRGIVSLESLLLGLFWHMFWAITLIQVTALTIAATRQASHVLTELDREAGEHDLLTLPSELEYLSTTRSGGGKTKDDFSICEL